MAVFRRGSLCAAILVFLLALGLTSISFACLDALVCPMSTHALLVITKSTNAIMMTIMMHY